VQGAVTVIKLIDNKIPHWELTAKQVRDIPWRLHGLGWLQILDNII